MSITSFRARVARVLAIALTLGVGAALEPVAGAWGAPPPAPEPVERGDKGGEPDGLPPPPPNDLCENAVYLPVPQKTFGTTIGATMDAPPAFFCDTSIDAPGVWYLIVGTGTRIRLTTCSPLTNYDTKINVFCGCGNGCMVGNDDDNVCTEPGFTPPGWRSTVSWCAAPGVGYMVLVQGYGGAVGDFEIIASEDDGLCLPDECSVPIVCPPGATNEIDPSRGGLCPPYTSDPDGGCNDAELRFQPIHCGETVCGTVAYDGSTRDTDWYAFNAGGACVTWTVECEFDALIVMMDGSAGCPAPFRSYDFVPAYGRRFLTYVGPGMTYFFVAPLFTNPVIPCGAQEGFRYTATLDCTKPFCELPCAVGAVTEDEFDCGMPVDTVNGGCNYVPNVFTPLPCTAEICGTFASDTSLRDTDWYSVELSAATCDLYFLVASMQPVIIGLIETVPAGSPNCSDVVGFAIYETTTDECQQTQISSTVGPGTHYLFVASASFTNIPCDPCVSSYVGWLFTHTDCCADQGKTFEDCNGNQIADIQDIQDGSSADCAGHSPAGLALTTRGDGVPDECQCVADWDANGIVNSTDLAQFINDWFADLDSGTTFTNIYDCRNSGVNSTDVSAMINEYFAASAGLSPGCP